MEPCEQFNLLEQDTETLFIAIYLLVCDGLKQITDIFGPLRRSPNAIEPLFTDAELLTCVIVGELRQFNSERAWYRELASTWRSLFPELVCWSRYKRRVIAAGQVIELFRRQIVWRTCADHCHERLVDGKPIELAHLVRARGNLNKRFRPNILVDKHAPDGWRIKPDAGWADIGYCASKKEFIFGMKLHIFSTLERVPMSWTLTPMTGSEREALHELVEQDPLVLRGGWLRIFGDKGYVDQDLAVELWEVGGHDLQASPKRNSKAPWPKPVQKMVSSARQGVETCFAEGGRFFGFERMRPASLGGLLASMAAKLTALTLRTLQHLIPPMLEGRI